MFCENCGVKLSEGSNFCDQCGQKLLPESTPKGNAPVTKFYNYLEHSRTQIVNLVDENLKQKLGVSLVVLLIVGVVIGFIQSYSKTQTALQKTQKEIISLQEKTNDTIFSQQKLIEQQGESIAKQDATIQQEQTNETLLKAAISDANSQNNGSPNINSINQSLKAIAPSVVKLFCIDNPYSNSLKQGSGILYKDGSGNFYVQTNLHVVKPDDGSLSKCAIVVYPDYKNTYNYLLFRSESYKFFNDNIDIAVLTPELISGNDHAGDSDDLSRYSIDRTQYSECESVDIGERLSILGYPGVGGDTLTVTDGIVSGFELIGSARLIKTSAKIEHGNSGGVAIKNSGCIVGIPTYATSGDVESIGRIIDLYYLYNITLK